MFHLHAVPTFTTLCHFVRNKYITGRELDDSRQPGPRRVKELGPDGNCGDAARRACAEWRWTATQLLLDSAAGEGGLVLAMEIHHSYTGDFAAKRVVKTDKSI